MSFTAGLFIGLMLGASVGIPIVAMIASSKIADLYDKIDEMQTRGWPMS